MTDNDTMITSDHPLSPENQAILPSFLNALVPPGGENSMPGAGELDFATYLKDEHADTAPLVDQGLSAFLTLAEDHPDVDITRSGPSELAPLVSEFEKAQPELFQLILSLVYTCYYQDDRVLVALGMEPGPPFPRGNTVEPGDLSLLDPVRERGKIYRE